MFLHTHQSINFEALLCLEFQPQPSSSGRGVQQLLKKLSRQDIHITVNVEHYIFIHWTGNLLLCRPDWVIDQTFDLFVELGASDDQVDFPVIYASGVNGIAGLDPDDMADTLQPLFEAVVREVQPISVLVID